MERIHSKQTPLPTVQYNLQAAPKLTGAVLGPNTRWDQIQKNSVFKYNYKFEPNPFTPSPKRFTYQVLWRTSQGRRGRHHALALAPDHPARSPASNHELEWSWALVRAWCFMFIHQSNYIYNFKCWLYQTSLNERHLLEQWLLCVFEFLS